MKKIILVLLAFISTGAEAKLSSEKIEKQAENINTVLSVCAVDRSSLDDIKGKAIGSTITSGVAVGASGAGAVTSFVALGKTKELNVEKGVDESKKANSQAKNLRLISTISSGVATGANLATVVLSATSATKLAELMDKATYCNNALSVIEISE